MSPTTFEKVDKLDGTNYALWSFKVKMYLRPRGLWGQVDGSAALDVGSTEQAHAAIVLSLTNSQVLHVIGTTTAAEAWLTLKQLNESKDMADRMWVKEKFSTFRYSASTMEKHIEDLEALVIQMEGAGCRPDEEDICATLLRSLPASFEGLAQAFRMSVMEFTHGDVISHLLAEDIRQKEAGRIEEETVMLAGRGRYEGRRNEGRNEDGRLKNKNKMHIQCYGCGKYRHMKRECPNRGENNCESNVAFHAFDSDGAELSEWIADSGASNHMCAST